MALFGSFSNVVIMGNMTRDIEARTIPTGSRVASVTVAVTERVKKGDNYEDQATFVDVTVWDKQVEWIERFGGKGKPIVIQGRLRQDKWVDKQTGQNRSKLVVVAENITFPSGGGNGGGGGGGARDNNRSRGNGGGQQQGRGSTGGMPYAQNVDDVGGWGDGGGGYDDYDGGDYPGEGGYNAPAGKAGADAPPWQS